MTTDVIALTPRMPDTRGIVAALMAAGPELRVRSVADSAVLQLCGDDGRPLLSVESPLLVRVPGEPARLLGPAADSVTVPTWWIETRASTAVPGAERLAGLFAGHLARQLDGTVWPPEAAIPSPAPAPVDPDSITVPPPVAAQPAVDVLTDRAAIVIQDRPVVPMTSWLSDSLRGCLLSGRALQIVTPPETRLTFATRTALPGLPHRWVVRDVDDTYYDGLSGARLRWNDGAFTAVEAPAAASFASGPHPDGTQLLLTSRTCHPATEHLLLGGTLETAWRALTGAPPAGWATGEPANLPWSRADLTRLARDRAPDGTWIVAVGAPDRPAVATVRITRTQAGVEEEVTLGVGYFPGESPGQAALLALAAELAAAGGLQSLLVQHRAGRSDLTLPAHFEGLPVPTAFVLGPEPVGEIGQGHARDVPPPITATELTTATGPALYYPLDDQNPAAAWARLDRLARHLRVPAPGLTRERHVGGTPSG